MHFAVRLVKIKMRILAFDCAIRRKQTDVGPEFEIVALERAMSRENVQVALLRRLARREWELSHILSLTRVQLIQLALRKITRAVQSCADIAAIVGKEDAFCGVS